MGGYRYLILVGGLALAMFALAGVLLSAEEIAQERDAREDALPAVEGASSGQRARPGPLDRMHASPRRAIAVAEDLGAIREGLVRARAGDLESLRAVRAAHERVLASVLPQDWPLLAAELGRADAPDGYRSLLVVAAGASRAKEAVPLLVEEYGRRRLKAVDALQRHGTDAAFQAMSRLYAAAADSPERCALLRAMRPFADEDVAAFLAGLIERETDPQALLVALTECRFQTAERTDLAAALSTFCRSAGAVRDVELLPRALNSLAALPGGARRVLDLALDGRVDDLRRARAAEALSFSRAPELVGAVAASLAETPGHLDERLRFVQRNARAADLEAVDAVLPRLDEATRERLAEAVVHLR